MKTGIFFLTGTCSLMLIALFILPVWMAPGYSIVRNTISELGAQSLPYSWIINSLLAALAIGTVTAGWRCYEGYVFQRIYLSIFSSSLLLAALFDIIPVGGYLLYINPEEGWHSYIMQTAWLSFIILTFSTALIAEKPGNRKWSVISGLSAISLLLLVNEADQVAGIWQRLQFILTYSWMIFTFKSMDL